VGFVLYVERVSKCVKEEYYREFRKRTLNYEIVEEFFTDLKEEFGSENDEMLKVVKLKKMIKEFV